MRKKSVRSTILLIIIIGFLLPMIVIIVVSGLQYKRQSEKIAKDMAVSIADEYSDNIEKEFNEVFSIANVFGDIQTAMINEDGRTAFSSEEILKNQVEILKRNKQVLAFYVIYHPGHLIDINTGELNQTLALIGNTQYKGDISPLVFWDYSYKSNVPDSLKKGDGYALLPPYKDVYSKDTLRMISYLREIKHGEEIIGVAGVDIAINWIQDFISQSEIFNKKASIKIVSNRGIINADNSDESMVGNLISKDLESFAEEKEFLFADIGASKQVNGSFVFYQPIKFNKLKDSWHIRIQVPEDEIVREARSQLILRVLVAIVIATISLVITFFYFNRIVGRIRNLAAAAKRMAKGNLYVDFQVVGDDEITDLGKSLQSIITRFSEIISGVKKTMEQFRESGNALSNTAVKLSEGATEQASSTQEVSASMEQMSANIEQNAENAKIADNIAQKSSKEIEESSIDVKATAGSMGDIASKTSIIGDIAFQVNILALNAAVEAARAGVHGKGFGVVANEVGKLADRSKLAALEIDELTNKSLLIAKKSGQSLEEIVPEIKRTAELVQYIANASLEQKSGAEQINNAIQQLNNVTQQNASIAENLTSNVEALSMLSEKLNKLIAFFKLEARKKREKGEPSAKNKITENGAIRKRTPSLKKEAFESGERKSAIERSEAPKKENDSEIKEVVKEPIKEKTIIKSKSKGIDLDLGEDDILDDGFEKF